ncbi:HupE/UreJ family protein [Methylotenera versatilis]|uniref:HupE/UreJ family protein n=1 Tax=Methylotenera versatilis TaxID=1055487 RepID=UPI00064775C1|nr:HupE/UreJ family protein [Methylotenera versatilis]
MKKIVLTSLLVGFSSLAIAHPGHELVGTSLDSAYAGFIHPLTGWDHLLVMLAIGIWASKLGGKARWQLPLTFLTSMTLGAILGLAGITFSGVETAIAASVMAMGLLLAINLPIPAISRIGIVAIFAVFHGMAHGVELHSQQSYAALGGMLMATALLHAIGLMLASRRLNLANWIQSLLAWGIALVGGYMLVAI